MTTTEELALIAAAAENGITVTLAHFGTFRNGQVHIDGMAPAEWLQQSIDLKAQGWF